MMIHQVLTMIPTLQSKFSSLKISWFTHIHKMFHNKLLIYIHQYFPVRSMIITGCSPWTVYDCTFFGNCTYGYSACFYPSDTTNCYPSFFKNYYALADPDCIHPDYCIHWSEWVISVRRGCFSDNKIYGESLPFKGTFANGAVGRFSQELGNGNTDRRNRNDLWAGDSKSIHIWYELIIMRPTSPKHCTYL